MNEDTLSKQLHTLGLSCLGRCKILEEDQHFGITSSAGSDILLIGNIGSNHFDQYCVQRHSPQQSLDAFTESALEKIFTDLGFSQYFFPSRKPYVPFQRWGRRAEIASPSLLGLDIHPKFGLWFAYRAAVLIPQDMITHGIHENKGHIDICGECTARPCQQACPAHAVHDFEFDVATCQDYIIHHLESSCANGGCNARLACPIGKDYQYHQKHLEFHALAYKEARFV